MVARYAESVKAKDIPVIECYLLLVALCVYHCQLNLSILSYQYIDPEN